MYERGTLRGSSIRFQLRDHSKDDPAYELVSPSDIPKDADVAPWVREYGGARWLKTSLLEWSLAPLPMDNKALSQRVRSGEIPQKLLGLLAANPEIKTRDGVPIFRVDEQIVKEVDAKLIVDLGAARQDEGEKPAEDERPKDDGTQDGQQDQGADETPGEGEEITGEDATDSEPEESGESDETQQTDARAATLSPPEDEDVDRAVVPFSIHGNSPKLAERETPWDAAAARRRVARWASSDGSGKKDKINWQKYRRAFVRYDADNAENFGSYGGPHHDVRDGSLVVVYRGVSALAQRISQKAFKVPDSEYSGMRGHVAREYRRFGEKAPWERTSGRSYEFLHDQLRQLDQGESPDHMRRSIIEIACELFGENERLREPWEEVPYLRENESVWASVRDLLVDGLVDAVVEEDLDALIDTLIPRMLETFEPLQGELSWRRSAIAEIENLTGLSLRASSDMENFRAVMLEVFGAQAPVRSSNGAQLLKERAERALQKMGVEGGIGKSKLSLLDAIVSRHTERLRT
jgi:hypothetical protein